MVSKSKKAKLENREFISGDDMINGLPDDVLVHILKSLVVIPNKLNFPSLQSLHVENVEFADDNSEPSRCHALHTLILRCRDCANSLNISNSSLTNLTISAVQARQIVLSTTNLSSFSIRVSVDQPLFSTCNFSLLREVYIQVCLHRRAAEAISTMMKWLQVLSNVKDVDISLICLVFDARMLVLLAGITSGLALGLLSFSQVDLEVLIKAGLPKDKKYAERIQPLVKKGHFVLCTLLLGKSLAMEALPLFMDSILPPGFTILMSAPLVTVFAEILPQAVCSKYGLFLGAKMAPIVQLLLVFFFPITYPASKVLDWVLGKEHSVLLRRSELKTFVDLHANEAGKGGELSHHETSIITGAMDLTQKTAKDAMTPISETFSLDINSKLDMHTMTQIMIKGHSRIPIHSGNPRNIVGLILVKNLMFCRPEDETPIKNLIIRKIPRVYENWPLYEILNQFQKGHSHMAVVLKSNRDTESTMSHALGAPTFLNIITHTKSNPAQVAGESDSSFILEISQTSSVHEYALHSSNEEFHSPTLKNVMELSEVVEPESGYFSQEQAEPIPDVIVEEVIGIITMEDVMEELLQGTLSFGAKKLHKQDVSNELVLQHQLWHPGDLCHGDPRIGIATSTLAPQR
ncbi:hypothetical protein Fmac_016009 [Flemingia macrophylla]|uniref:CNNM transmembrane domain-containing protein n=1 Tax=Flemingia macrophylla TaxID=520843 RepID=A0ABD1MG61_9FABA